MVTCYQLKKNPNLGLETRIQTSKKQEVRRGLQYLARPLLGLLHFLAWNVRLGLIAGILHLHGGIDGELENFVNTFLFLG